MLRECEDCGENYDDARCLTYCPHHEFLDAASLERKDLAITLVSRDLHFANQVGGPRYRIESIDWIGMVTIQPVGDAPKMVGAFGPHLFVVAAHIDSTPDPGQASKVTGYARTAPFL